MSTLSRSSVALLLSSAFVLAIACGSSNKKLAPPASEGDGGEAGSTAAAAGAPSAGAASESAAGAGGALESGEAGSSGEGGSAGSAELACVPTGEPSGIDIDGEQLHQFCRGGTALLNLSKAADADVLFTCCGLSSAGYGVTVAGVGDGDGRGFLSFRVPSNAPKLTQSLSITCWDGELNNSANVELTDVAPPVLTALGSPIAEDGVLTLTGSNLGAVDLIYATPVEASRDGEASTRFCNIDPASHTDTHLDCTFGYIAPGQYVISAFAEECGAIAELTFTVATAI